MTNSISQNPHDRVLAATADDYEALILNHPLLHKVASEGVSVATYAEYLRQTAHVVKHTPRFLALTGARLEIEQRALRRYFLIQAEDEDGHDLLCVKDLAHLGIDPQAFLKESPQPGAWQLVTQSYYNATYGRPLGNLGLASLTEQMGATIAAAVCDMLAGDADIPNQSVGFLKSHAGFDVKHLDDIIKAVNLVTDPDDLDDVIYGRRMAIRGYSQLFTDVMNTRANHKDLQAAA